MKLRLRAAAVAGALLITVSGGAAAFAQEQGGILRVYHWDSPASTLQGLLLLLLRSELVSHG